MKNEACIQTTKAERKFLELKTISQNFHELSAFLKHQKLLLLQTLIVTFNLDSKFYF